MTSIFGKQSRLALGVIFFLIILVGMSQYILSQEEPAVNTPQQDRISNQAAEAEREAVKRDTVRVRLSFDDNNTFEGRVKAKTVYEALQRFTEEKGLAFEVSQEKFGLVIERVSDKGNSSSVRWEYTVNGKPGILPIDRYTLQPADLLDVKFGI